MSEYNFNVNKLEGKRINALFYNLRRKELEMLSAERYKRFGNVANFPMMFMADMKPGQGFETYHVDGNGRNRVEGVKAYREGKKDRDLRKLGAAKGQTHMGDFVKGK